MSNGVGQRKNRLLAALFVITLLIESYFHSEFFAFGTIIDGVCNYLFYKVFPIS